MDDFKEKLYSDNLHNYNYDDLVNDELVENLIEQDTDNSPYRKYKSLKKSYTGFCR